MAIIVAPGELAPDLTADRLRRIAIVCCGGFVRRPTSREGNCLINASGNREEATDSIETASSSVSFPVWMESRALTCTGIGIKLSYNACRCSTKHRGRTFNAVVAGSSPARLTILCSASLQVGDLPSLRRGAEIWVWNIAVKIFRDMA